MFRVKRACVKDEKNYIQAASKSICTDKNAIFIDHQIILTLSLILGYLNKLTAPKSSPVATNLLSLDRLQVLISVPSAPSGQIPKKRGKNIYLFTCRKVGLPQVRKMETRLFTIK